MDSISKMVMCSNYVMINIFTNFHLLKIKVKMTDLYIPLPKANMIRQSQIINEPIMFPMKTSKTEQMND
jgi:hypothetical protein